MSASLEKTIKNLLKTKNIFLTKRLGQNFLINKHTLKKIVASAEVNENDTILEIGAGLGTLTAELSEKAKKVIAIEKDKRLFNCLKENLKNFKNVKIYCGDILKTQILFEKENSKNLSENKNKIILPKNYKIVANIPYYITSRLIKTFLEAENQPKLIVLMVQKELAQRICAKAPKMNLLALSVQFYGKVKIISYVSKENFFPKPKVDSAIIKIKPFSKKNPKKFRVCYFKLIKAGFSSPRKKLVNNLSNKLKLNKEKIENVLSEINLSQTIRAEELNIEKWKLLTKKFLNDII